VARELIRSLLAYAVAVAILTFYGGRVCPLIDSLGLGRLAGILAGCFAAGAVLKLAAIAVMKPHERRMSPWTFFFADLVIWVSVAIVFAAFDALVWKFPFWTSGMKMAIGTLAIGFYASAFDALRRERELIELVAAGSVERFVAGPPLNTAQRFFSFTAGSLLLMSGVLLLLLYKDLVMEQIPIVVTGNASAAAVEVTAEPTATPTDKQAMMDAAARKKAMMEAAAAAAAEPTATPTDKQAMMDAAARKKAMMEAAAAAAEPTVTPTDKQAMMDAAARKKAMMEAAVTRTQLVMAPREWSGAIFREVLFVLGVLLAGTLLVTRQYASNLRRMFELEQRALDAVKGGRFDVTVPVVSRDEFSDIADGTNAMIAGLREKEKFRSILGKVVSPTVAKRILESGGMLGGDTVEATILFTDLRDYTALSEKVTPQQLVTMLNEYFNLVNRIVEKNGGFVNKFIGDAVMAIYGLDTLEGSCDAAFATALEVQAALVGLNESFVARGLPAIENGIGIHHGTVIAGVIGAEERVEFTVIGDTVNTAARLESLTKSLSSFAAVSNVVFDRIPATRRGKLSPVGEHQLKGKAEKTLVYGLLETRVTRG